MFFRGGMRVFSPMNFTPLSFRAHWQMRNVRKEARPMRSVVWSRRDCVWSSRDCGWLVLSHRRQENFSGIPTSSGPSCSGASCFASSSGASCFASPLAPAQQKKKVWGGAGGWEAGERLRDCLLLWSSACRNTHFPRLRGCRLVSLCLWLRDVAGRNTHLPLLWPPRLNPRRACLCSLPRPPDQAISPCLCLCLHSSRLVGVPHGTLSFSRRFLSTPTRGGGRIVLRLAHPSTVPYSKPFG